MKEKEKEKAKSKEQSENRNMNSETNAFKWIFRFAGQKKSNYIISVILAICGAIFQVLPFLVLAHIIQQIFAGNTDFNAYLTDILLILLFWVLRVVFHSVSTTFSHKGTFAVLGNIRKMGLEKLEKMPLGDIQAKGSGGIKNTLVERIDSIEIPLAHIIPEVSGNLAVIIATLIYLFTVDWRMGLASLATFPIGLICFSCMMIGYEPSYKRTVVATKNLNDTSVEYINGIEVIKVFGKAKSSYEKFVAAAKEGAASYVDWMRKSNVYFTLGFNVMPATLLAVLPIGGILLKNGSLSVETFILATIVAMGAITPLITVLSYNDDLAKLGTIIGEVVDIIDGKEMSRPKVSEELPKDNGITLENVHFGYGEEEVLHGINLQFKPGTVNALVGPSGGGKSTIAKLIASFWDVNSGSVKIGGADVRKISGEDFYKRIAYVSQENFLFDETVLENIRMGKAGATDEEVYEAARKCGCYDFIMSLENGFNTIVGGGGNHLSGGEKQRIAIARAMLKDAPIIILDEATAYTDPENEAIIQSSVAKLVQGKTLIVIAHRLSTIVDADQIIVVNQGNIEATGKHNELLEKCKLYKTLWESHISSKDSLNGGEQYV